MSIHLLCRRRALPLLCGALAAVALAVPPAGASESPPDSGAAGATLINQPGLLVLKNGRVVAGRLTQSAGGYLVERPSGSFLVPFESVDFPARDLSDAWRIFHEQTSRPNLAFHMRLARWCLTHGMQIEAREELVAALEIDPRHVEARNMLRRVDGLLGGGGFETPSAAAIAEPRIEYGFDAPEATSLAGLSRESARVFTTRVQPLLMNKCATAGCHAPQSNNGFELSRVRHGRGANRAYAEQNLAATLDHIDLKRPRQSLLLSAPQGNHGRAGRTIFAGPFGTEQFNLLQEWVLEVARERSGHAAQADRGPLLDPRTGAPRRAALPTGWSAAATPPPDNILPAPLSAAVDVAMSPFGAARAQHRTIAGFAEGHAPASESPDATRTLAPAPDAFDPAIFNRSVDSPDALRP